MSRVAGQLLRWMIVLGAIGGAVGLSLAIWINSQLPPLDNLSAYEPALITQVYDRQGKLLTEFAAERRIIVPLDDMPDVLKNAFLAAEDHNFYDHFGIEPLGILRAAWKNLLAGRTVQGASTITQQVARSFFLTQARTYIRKIREIFLALKLERNLSKDEILFLYLNQIYLGRGAYGVGAAAQMYFGKAPADLTLAESAIIAGLPPAPTRYAPHVSPEKARLRQVYVLDRMLETGVIGRADHATALAEGVAVMRWNSPFWLSPYASEAIRGWLLERFPEDAVMRGGLKVYTTIDKDGTAAAEEAVRRGLEALDKRQGYRGPITTLASAEVPGRIAEIREELTARRIEHLSGGVIRWVAPDDWTPPVHASAGPVTDGTMVNEPFPGVVTAISKDQYAWVDFGIGVGRLPAIGMLWARKLDPDVAAGAEIINHPRERLQVGDVIQVKRLTAEDITASMMPQWVKDKALEKLAKIQEMPGPLLLALEQRPRVQAALASILPDTGEILAVVGGYSYSDSQFNRALQALRQPGSAFKPIVYSLALDSGYTPASVLIETPVIYQDVEREYRWKPKNYEDKFFGPMTIVDALTHSRNLVTIQLVRRMGISRIIQRAQDLGIESALPSDLSMALGSGVVYPVEILRPYAAFANGGLRPELSLVREVWDATGTPVYQYFPPVTDAPAIPFAPFTLAPPPAPADVPFGLRSIDPVAAPELDGFPRVLSEETAYQMTYLLRNVVERGTGWRARALGRPTAGKTGTTDDNIDSWFVGYTSQVATSVWVGFDQLQPLGKYETGSRAAIPIWLEYMQAIHKGLPYRDFPGPEAIIYRNIDAKTGKLATPLSEKVLPAVPFREGTEPDVQRARPSDPQNAADLFFKTDDFIHNTEDW